MLRFSRNAGKAGGAGGRRALLPEREVFSQPLPPLPRRRRPNGVKSRYVVPPFSVKVSESRTGQDACQLKLAPRLVSKRWGKLIDG